VNDDDSDNDDFGDYAVEDICDLIDKARETMREAMEVPDGRWLIKDLDQVSRYLKAALSMLEKTPRGAT